MPDLILADARLPSGRIVDITIRDGRVYHIGSSAKSLAAEVISCNSCLCVPAATDMHVHMRDGTQKAKEDWGTGTLAAVAGGVSTVVDQPNSVPSIDTKEIFQARVELASREAYTRFAINGSLNENADVFGLARAGVLAFGEMFAAPSSYGQALTPEVIARVTADATSAAKLITVHAEEVLEGAVHNLKEHSESRPESGEAKTISLVNSLAPENARLHYCHISTPESFASMNACGASQTITFEVAPHHLFLSYEMAEDIANTHMRMNPPLRSESTRKNLYAAFDSIPVIASDHAPHTILEKAADFASAPSGIPGVETMLPLLMNEVFLNRFSLESVIEKTVTNPNKILGLESPAFVKGARADFAVYEDVPRKVKAEDLHSKCGWTPYEGMDGLFPWLTLVSGVPAWNKGEASRDGACYYGKTEY